MVAGAFPLAKLAYLGLRQVSKPVANQIKNGAKRSHLFRNYVCLPTAQLYHWAETTIKMYLLGLGKPTSVSPLNEQMAVELGADILGEMLVFTFAAGTLTFEVMRSNAKAQQKEEALYDRIQRLESQLQTVELQNERNSARIQHLQNQLYYSGPVGKLKKHLGRSSSTPAPSSDPDIQATPNSGLDQKKLDEQKTSNSKSSNDSK